MTTTQRGAKTLVRPLLLALLAAAPLLATGCRQRMSDQPYYRPLEYAEFYKDTDGGRASRPLERGTIHRAQYLETDSIATGLTLDEWGRSYEFATPAKVDAPPLTDAEKVRRAIGAPRYDPRVPAQPKVFVDAFPFKIGQTELKRGQERYTIFCAVCHGPLGNGQGKIWERGYLTPTSFHTQKVTPTEVDLKNKEERLGYSRGYKLWKIDIPMDDVPVGYYFEVITRGYGGMPSYSAQIPPDDRWKIIAYIRVLQMSQRTDPAKLPADVKKLLDEAGGKK